MRLGPRFSFSWKRAIGLSGAKARLSRRIGVPLTRSGQERKVGRTVIGYGGLAILGAVALAVGQCQGHAEEFKAAIGRENPHRCHMDTCDPFTLTSSTLVGRASDGELYKVTYTTREDEYRQRRDGSEYDHPPVKRGETVRDEFYVFCSKTRPEFFYKSDGAWASNALRPGDEDGVYGATDFIHLQYWAACHNYITDDAVSTKLAKKLGYHLRPQDDNYREDRSPQDALSEGGER